MKPTKADDVNNKIDQTARALIAYLLRHDIHDRQDAISLPEWAVNAAKMMNENLLVNLYETIARRLVFEDLQTKRSEWLVTNLVAGEVKVFFDIDSYHQSLEKEDN